MQTLTAEQLIETRAIWTIGIGCGMDFLLLRLHSNNPNRYGDFFTEPSYYVRGYRLGRPASDGYNYFGSADDLMDFIAERYPTDQELDVYVREAIQKKIAALTPQANEWNATPYPWEA